MHVGHLTTCKRSVVLLVHGRCACRVQGHLDLQCPTTVACGAGSGGRILRRRPCCYQQERVGEPAPVHTLWRPVAVPCRPNGDACGLGYGVLGRFAPNWYCVRVRISPKVAHPQCICGTTTPSTCTCRLCGYGLILVSGSWVHGMYALRLSICLGHGVLVNRNAVSVGPPPCPQKASETMHTTLAAKVSSSHCRSRLRDPPQRQYS